MAGGLGHELGIEYDEPKRASAFEENDGIFLAIDEIGRRADVVFRREPDLARVRHNRDGLRFRQEAFDLRDFAELAKAPGVGDAFRAEQLAQHVLRPGNGDDFFVVLLGGFEQVFKEPVAAIVACIDRPFRQAAAHALALDEFESVLLEGLANLMNAAQSDLAFVEVAALFKIVDCGGRKAGLIGHLVL